MYSLVETSDQAKLPGREKKFALRLHQVSSAYRLWINDDLADSAGIVGTKKEETVSFIKNQIITIPPLKTDSVAIVLQLANYDDNVGGIWGGILFGIKTNIRLYSMRNIAGELFCLGIIIAISFFHLLLFMCRKKDLLSLYFALFCLVIGLRILHGKASMAKDPTTYS